MVPSNVVAATAVYASVLIYCTHFVCPQGMSDDMWISLKECTTPFTKLTTKHAAFDSPLFPKFCGISSDLKRILNERLYDNATAFFTTYVTNIQDRHSSNLGRTPITYSK